MELAFLSPLLAHPGPWASVYLNTSRSTEDAAAQQDLRDRAAARALAAQGAPAATGTAVLDRLRAEPVSHAPAGRALFATDGEVVLDLPLTGAPTTVETHWTPLPHTAPLLALRDEEPHCLVAYIDRTGADLELRTPYERIPVGQAEGRGWQGRGHRSIPADRYEWHYQHRVENGWERTADIIAEEIATQAARLAADGDGESRMIVLTGDPRERHSVHERLPSGLRPLTAEIDGGARNPGTSAGPLDERLTLAWRRHVAERVNGVLDRFRAARRRPGEHGADPEGVEVVVEPAITRGRQLDEHA
ncbi:baeRF2 domain-containing protein, partial [Kitasatospora sp. NPDC004240]